MTRNWYRDGGPTGPWACASQTSAGTFGGVSFGLGRTVIGFVPEAMLDYSLHDNAQVAEDEKVYLTLVRDAAAQNRPRFKAISTRIAAAANN
jgi:hypothetical protein